MGLTACSTDKRDMASKTPDMEITIANRHGKLSSTYEFKRIKRSKENSKSPKALMMEAMTAATNEPV